MARSVKGITYRERLIRGKSDLKALPTRMWLVSDLSPEVRASLEREDILSLGGAHGDASLATPVQYDDLLIELEDGDVIEIQVFNRAAALFRSRDEKLLRIHRFLSLLDKNPLHSESLSELAGSRVPAPDDPIAWDQANIALVVRYGEQAGLHTELGGRRAVKRYFGDSDRDYSTSTFDELRVVLAYLSWVVLDYRPGPKHATVAEAMLEDGLPEAQTMLLRAKMDSYPSLYRVAGHDMSAGTVRMEDALFGDTVMTHDRWLRENVEEGMFVIGRVFQIGELRLFEQTGPPLLPEMIDDAVEFLRSEGLEFTREGLRRGAHLFGRLWGWMGEWSAENLIENRGVLEPGEEAEGFQCATFSVADESDVRRRLRERRDIDYDDAEDEFAWLGETDDEPLAYIWIEDGNLVLQVESSEQLAKARKWLDEMPGVNFLTVEVFEDDADEDADDDQEIERMAQSVIDKYCSEWMDMPLPVLGGKSPRQASRNPETREKVAGLIRSMPELDPGVPAKVPREAMLRELGLPVELLDDFNSDSDDSPEPPRPPQPYTYEPPPRPVTAAEKVGRNAPCPCGSGKKYKKCCGR